MGPPPGAEGHNAAGQQDRQPRLGPDGQPLPPRSKRPRKPIGPDANGNGPDGKPWDPERRAQRQAERATQQANGAVPVSVNEAVTTPVEAKTPTE